MMSFRLRRSGTAIAVTVLAGLIVSAATAPAVADPNNNTSRELRAAVNADGVLEHQRVLQEIADRNHGTRVSGTPGYDESADYAEKVFRDAGYDVTRQAFTFQTFIPLEPSKLQRVSPNPADLEHAIMSYSGSTDTTAQVAVPSGSPLGCAAADFAGFPAGQIALVSRGTCPFAQKATNAHAAGASGAVIYNNIAGSLNGTLSETFTLDFGVVGITQALGQELVAQVPSGLTMRLFTRTFRGQAETYNVFAETPEGDPDNVVMAGAHLDSVAAGPGINDNGSGAGAILEIAEQMEKVKPKNKVRFALWGAEESGLVGSTRYIASLSADAIQKIALYLNFDMIGSPNYVRFVYDGDNSAFPPGPGAAVGPPGSGAIEGLFHDYFASQDLASAETPFSGRSDYGPFIAAGVDIPSGGLFTGAEGIKTPEQAAIFGGTAGAPYDPCYHQACDTIDNVSKLGLDEMVDAVAHAVITYADSTHSVNGVGKGHKMKGSGTGTPSGATNPAGGGLHDDDHTPVES
jgi:Zn-dependent M28 family amino/carboxypeptidase